MRFLPHLCFFSLGKSIKPVIREFKLRFRVKIFQNLTSTESEPPSFLRWFLSYVVLRILREVSFPSLGTFLLLNSWPWTYCSSEECFSHPNLFSFHLFLTQLRTCLQSINNFPICMMPLN